MKVIVNGAAGRMGSVVMSIINNRNDGSTVVAAVDSGTKKDGFFTSLSDFCGAADVIIDFSHHSASGVLFEYAKARGLPVVIGTTGHSREELEIIRLAAESVPVFHSGNMSVGVAALIEAASKIALTFPDADIEIIETHHNRKLDSPSGTALMIADSLRKVRPASVSHCGRSGAGKREKNEIGISSVRYGNVVGIHEIIISTDSQTLTLKHEVHDRALFAEGAVAAASFIIGRAAGLYNMNNILKDQI